MFCTECGEENRNDRKFCTNCGSPLKDYTKPRENLIMPEEIQKQQETIAKKNKLKKIFRITSCLCLLIAIILTISTFFIQEKIQLVFTIICFVMYLLFFVLLIAKKIVINIILKS